MASAGRRGNPGRVAEAVLAAALGAEERLHDQVFDLPRSRVREIEREQNYVVTCAQNNTPVDRDVLETLLRVAEAHEAILLVVPIRYKNPTGWTPFDGDTRARVDRWAPELLDHMVEAEVQLHRKLVLRADWRMQATTQRPLRGKESVASDQSVIFGHPRRHMLTVANPTHAMPKMLYTTGSVTRPNYSDTDLGKKGERHHLNGGLLVRTTRGKFHVRRLVWDAKSRSICDWATRYMPEGAAPCEASALVLGDEHAVRSDPKVMDALFRDGGVVDQLRPDYLVRHDVHDNLATSHHDRRDPVKRYARRRAGFDDLKAELDLTCDHLERYTRPWLEDVIVDSNHHRHVMRWLKEADPKDDPQNALLYHRLMARVLELTEVGPGGQVYPPDPFALYAREFRDPPLRARFLRRVVDQFELHGIALHLHGDEGADGGWCSPEGLAKLGSRSLTGHTHRAWELEGAGGVGHLAQMPDYVGALSSWLQTIAVVHPNGKWQLVHFVDGEC